MTDLDLNIRAFRYTHINIHNFLYFRPEWWRRCNYRPIESTESKKCEASIEDPARHIDGYYAQRHVYILRVAIKGCTDPLGGGQSRIPHQLTRVATAAVDLHTVVVVVSSWVGAIRSGNRELLNME